MFLRAPPPLPDGFCCFLTWMPCRLHFRSSQTESCDEHSPVFVRVVVCGYFLTVLFHFWGFERLFPQVGPGSLLGPRMGLTFGLSLAAPGVVLLLSLLSEGLFCAVELFLRHYAWSYSRFGVGVPRNLRATEGKASLRPKSSSSTMCGLCLLQMALAGHSSIPMQLIRDGAGLPFEKV